MDPRVVWLKENRRPGDHMVVETAGLRLSGAFESVTSTKLTMTLDTKEVLVLRIEDLLDVDGAWPK